MKYNVSIYCAEKLFLFVRRFQVCVDSCGNRGHLSGRRLDVEAQSGIFYSLSCSGAETPDSDFALIEVGEVLFQGVHTGRAEEYKHIVVERFIGSEVVADSTVHNSLCAFDAILLKYFDVVLVNVGDREKEFLLGVLCKSGNKLLVVELAGNAEENFAFAILDVFLQIKRNLFGGAEIFHCIGNCKASFFANPEEVVDTCSRCEDNGREIGDGNSLLAKIFG